LITCAPKPTEAGERLAVAVVAVPVPVRVTVCILPATPLLLSLMVRVPYRAPPVVGVKVTLSVQLSPAGKLPPQLLVRAKSPLVVISPKSSTPLPGLDTVTVCAALVEPTFSVEV